MNENIKKFHDEVKKNTELQAKLKEAGEDKNAIADIAKAAGFNIAIADIEAEIVNASKGVLSDEELENVAGGVNFSSSNDKITISWDRNEYSNNVFSIVTNNKSLFSKWGVDAETVKSVIKINGKELYIFLIGWQLTVAGSVVVSANGIQ